MNVPAYDAPARKALMEFLDADEKRTQLWLAMSLDVTQSAVSVWLSGKSRPSVWYAFAIETMTGIAAEMWLTEEERTAMAALPVRAEKLLREYARKRAKPCPKADSVESADDESMDIDVLDQVAEEIAS